jgi:hypothetical protein
MQFFMSYQIVSPGKASSTILAHKQKISGVCPIPSLLQYENYAYIGHTDTTALKYAVTYAPNPLPWSTMRPVTI